MLSRKYTSNFASEVFFILAMLLLQSLLIPGAEGVVDSIAIRRQDACTADGETDFCVCNIQDPNTSNVRCIDVKTDYVPNNIPAVTRVLYLNRCGIKKIYERDFMGLEYLQTLYLGNNEISDIHPNAFRNLYRLERLVLERNPIVKLDPSGRTFQHLSSLRQLFFTAAEITSINKFSFFSFAGAQPVVTVDMEGNPVQCDCNVKGLINWENSIAPSQITISDLQCVNANNLNYDDTQIDDSIFGTCSQQSTNVFQTRSICYDCQNQRTNYACKQQRTIECVGSEMVCKEEVLWNANLKQMYINSGCFSYQSCLSASFSNKDGCGLGYKSIVYCAFCCLGPTCDFTTIGGRTVDYTFDVRFGRQLPYRSYMSDPSSSQYQSDANTISEGITKILNGIDAGFDVYFSRYEPERSSNHRVVIRIEVTALNTLSDGLIRDQIEKKMNTTGSNPRGFLESQAFSNGSLRVRTASQVNSLPMECLNETTTGSKGTFIWPTTVVGMDVNVICPSSDPTTGSVRFATRKCDLNSQSVPQWSSVVDSDCISITPDDNPTSTLDDLVIQTVKEDNALEISTQLLEQLSEERSFMPEKMDKAVTVLEKFITTETLAVNGVPENIISTVSTLIDVDVEIIRQAQLEKSTSQRLLNIIDGVAAKSPLTRNSLILQAPNIAIAAQGIRRQENRNIVMTTGESSEENVQINLMLRSQWEPTEETGVSIPIEAVRDSVPADQQQNLQRSTFAVHRNDKLFYVSPRENQVQIQQVDDNQYLLQTELNSQIIAASIPDVTVENLNENITMSFLHDNTNSSNPQCVYWDQSLAGGQGDWTGEGCGVVETSNTRTTCGCNHLTNFALLMDVYQEGGGLSDLDKKVLSIISYIGCGISLMALLLTLVTYSIFRKLRRDNPSKILINLCIALFLSNLVFLVGMQDYAFDNRISCKIVAVLLHYFLLASLTWMAVEAFYMYLALVLVFKTYFTHFILKCSLVGWGVPLVIIMVTVAQNSTDNYGFLNSGLCWLKNPAFYIAFVAPVCIILLMNCAAFGLVIKQLMNMSSSKITKTDRASTIQRLRGAVGVVILLGLTWIFAIFAIDSASVAFYYLFAIFNSLQGLFIFLFYCLMKRDVMASWKRYLPCFEEFGDSTKTSSNSRASASVTAQQATRLNTKSNSSVDARTLSTASTVASNSRNSSNVYNTIDESETQQLNHDSEYTQALTADKAPSQTSQHLLSQSVESPGSSPNLNHVYGNVPSKFQNESGANPSQNSFSQPGSNIQYSAKNSNISIISPSKQEDPSTVNPAEINVSVNTNNGPRVRDLRLQFDRRTSNTSDFEITRI